LFLLGYGLNCWDGVGVGVFGVRGGAGVLLVAGLEFVDEVDHPLLEGSAVFGASHLADGCEVA
jgi:hypothetical protein